MTTDSYDQDRIDRLGDPNAFRYCSAEELHRFLASAPEWHLADFGSGTGLFTNELAPVVDTVFAIDIRQGLHEIYRETELPANVTLSQRTSRPFRSPPTFSMAGCRSERIIMGWTAPSPGSAE